MTRFDKEVAIITGGGGDIGLGIVSRLGQEGARVVIVDIDRPRGEKALQRLTASGVEVLLEIGDVGEPETAEGVVSSAVGAWGRIDILVNNAGAAGEYGNIWEVSVETLDQAYHTNLKGTFLFTRAVIPYMMERDYGRIINIASVAGKEGNPRRAAYSATKAGVIGLTKSVSKELATTGIRVNCVTPAVVMTRPVREADPREVQYMLERIPMGRSGKVEEVAALVAWLASEECSFSTGAVFDLSGGRATY